MEQSDDRSSEYLFCRSAYASSCNRRTSWYSVGICSLQFLLHADILLPSSVFEFSSKAFDLPGVAYDGYSRVGKLMV